MGIHQLYMPGLHLLKALSEHDSNYYPERLGRLFLVNAPSIFLKVWSTIKKWLDKGILDKIHIVGSDYKEILLTHIDSKDLPTFLGGSCKCSHMEGGCVPTPLNAYTQALIEFNESASLVDSHRPHVYELMVPMEEIVVSIQAKIAYKFKTNKKPCLFEIRFRKMGADEEKVIVPFATYESQTKTISGKIDVEPGFYLFYWKRSKGFTLGSVTLDYTVDLEFVDIPPSVENINAHILNEGADVKREVDEDSDEGEFVDADENE